MAKRNYYGTLATSLVLISLYSLTPHQSSAQVSAETIRAFDGKSGNNTLLKEPDETEKRILESAGLDCAVTPFGATLFSSDTPPSKAGIMSPKQRIMPGDRLALAVWGSVEMDEVTPVDSQGFIYIKGVGPVSVAGQTEDALSTHIRREIEKSYRDVQVYARLEHNAGTPVMVTGGISKPGQYYGGAEDSLVVWLQRAGGILPKQGSYRNIRILRDDKTLAETDLYTFLTNGKINRLAWQAGDVILVDPPHPQISVSGDVRRCALFELPQTPENGALLQDLAAPLPGTTHAIVNGHRNDEPFRQVYDLATLRRATLQDGDSLYFYAAPQSQTITVHVDGPIHGNSVMVVPIHTNLSDVLANIAVNADISDTGSIYIKRPGVATAQKAALEESLNRLLQSALTAPAQSDGEAEIRAREAELIEQFVSRARDIKPDGRVVVMRDNKLNDLPLENGDVIVIPQKTNIVSVEGEVVLPRTVVLTPGARVEDYVRMAGGYTERALEKDYIVIRPNGDALRDPNPVIQAGDRVLILPKVDSKGMQTTKDIVQILYQIAVGAGVLLKL